MKPQTSERNPDTTPPPGVAQQTAQEATAVLGGILLYGHLSVGDQVFCGPCFSSVSERRGCPRSERQRKGEGSGQRKYPIECKGEAKRRVCTYPVMDVQDATEEKSASPSGAEEDTTKRGSRGHGRRLRRQEGEQMEDAEAGDLGVDDEETAPPDVSLVELKLNQRKEGFVHDERDDYREARKQGQEESLLEKASHIPTNAPEWRLRCYYRQMRVASLRNSARQPVDFIHPSAGPTKWYGAWVGYHHMGELHSRPIETVSQPLILVRSLQKGRVRVLGVHVDGGDRVVFF